MVDDADWIARAKLAKTSEELRAPLSERPPKPVVSASWPLSTTEQGEAFNRALSSTTPIAKTTDGWAERTIWPMTRCWLNIMPA